MAAPAAYAQPTGSMLDIVLSNQNPYPVSPGGTVTIEVQMQNTGYTEATDKTIEIVPKEPFTLLPGQDIFKTISKIPVRGSYSITYRLKVSSTALTSTYPIEFRIYSGAMRDIYFSDSININVQGNPNLVIENLYTLPEDIEPGALADVVVKMKNIGTGTAHDLQLTLNSSNAELTPLLSKGKVYVGNIAPGESKTATLGLSIGSSAEEKTYTLKIFGDYKEEDNTAASDSFSIGLPVRGTINLDIIKKEPNYDRNTISIDVANKGTTEAKSVEAKLIVRNETGNETVGIDYASSLKANKKTTFEFPLVLHGSGQLVMNYIGPGIENSQATEDVTFNYTMPGSGDCTEMTAIVIIIIAIIAFFLYRRHRKKKHRRE